MAHPNDSHAISLAPMIAVEDFEFPVSGIRSSLAMPSPLHIPRLFYPASVPIPHYHFDCDRDLTNFPSLSVSGSGKRKHSPKRPKALEMRRLRICIPGRGIKQAATQSKTLVKIRIPAQKAASRISIHPSATSASASQDLDGLPQKLNITIPPTTKPLLLVDGPAFASQGFPVNLK